MLLAAARKVKGTYEPKPYESPMNKQPLEKKQQKPVLLFGFGSVEKIENKICDIL